MEMDVEIFQTICFYLITHIVNNNK